jgi:AcrR family transcriptional regulator
MSPTSPRPSRSPLTRDRVFRAAVRLADRHGLEALSMRRLATALKVEAMSLYNHVANKDDLLDAMVEHVYAEIEVPIDMPDWREAMWHRARSAREAFRRHPWATAVLESRVRPGPENLCHHDAVLGVLRRAGFTVELAGHAYALLDSVTFGFAVQEASLPFDSMTGASEMARSISDEGLIDQFPHLSEFIAERALETNYSFADEFAWSIDLVLDALDQMLADSREG